MINFLQKIRIAYKDRIPKGVKYAIREIALILFSIFIAVSYNNYQENKENNILKESYILSLKNNLKKDLIHLRENKSIKLDEEDELKSSLKRIYGPNANLDTIIKIARLEYDTGNSISNTYNNKTFDALIVTGNIDLFEKKLVESLIELNRLQLIETSVFVTNRDIYFERLNSYSEDYEQKTIYYKNSPVQDSLWSNIDGKKFTPKFLNLVKAKRWGGIRFMALTDSIILKTRDVISQLEKLSE